MIFHTQYRWVFGPLVLVAATSLLALGQSSSRGTQTVRQQPRQVRARQQVQGSTARQSQTRKAPVALEGYCPVCVIKMKKWVRGSVRYQVQYDGKTYRFPDQKQKDIFLASPEKYVPALGGDCTVCLARMNGKRVPGNIRYAAMHDGRLFLFPGDKQKQEFRKSPESYTNVDLALDGKCSVCKVEMQQDVDGNPDFATYHQGMRYLFPSDKQRRTFLANPTKYQVRS